MVSVKAATDAETQAMKLSALLIAALTVLLQMHLISARGIQQCTSVYPCTNGMCCNAKNYCGLSDSDCGPGCQSGPCTGGNHGKNHFGFSDFSSESQDMKMSHSHDDSGTTDKTATAANFVTAGVFDKVFPHRDGFYSFEAFVAATKAFPEFGSTGTAEAQKKDVAAFFAHIHHETEGLTKVLQGPTSGAHESADFCCSGSCLALNPSSKLFACSPGKKYFARGPLKLTWNYNYGSASKAVGADILAEPELLSKDAALSFKSALWLWMTPHSNAMPSGHDVMTGTWSPSPADIAANRFPGFGASIAILEGHAECGRESRAASSRTSRYVHITKLFNVDAGSHLDCSTMLPFN